MAKVKVQMTGVGGQVHRFQGTAGFLLDDVQALAEAQEILHVGKRSVAPPAIKVHHIGRAAHA